MDTHVEMDWSTKLSDRAKLITYSDIREILKVIQDPQIISFAGGVPEPKLFPKESIAKAYQEICSGPLCDQALQYSITEGYLPLREWISESHAKMGAKHPAEQILITNGSQQALDFLGKLLINPKDKILVTRPTYLGAIQAFSPYEPDFVAVQTDADGPVIEDLEQKLATENPKFFYLVPDFQNPTGVTVSEDRRAEIVRLTKEAGVLVIEDAAYQHLYFGDSMMPPLAAYDAKDPSCSNVIFCGTFSKTVVPALRVGWICAPAELNQRLVLIKQASDLHASTINQIALHLVVQDIFESHTANLRALYKERCGYMASALQEYLPESIHYNVPNGGLFFWLELPQGVDGRALLMRSIEDAKVAFVPGQAFFADHSGKNTIRLSFSMAGEAEISAGIERLGKLLRSL